MTIDLSRLETNPTWLGNNLPMKDLVELLRLARLGQIAERHDRLENTCVVCGASLMMPYRRAPHCQGCLVDEDQENEWLDKWELTIDLDHARRRVLAVMNDDETRELLRLARLGQEAERRKCGTCGQRLCPMPLRRVVDDWETWFCADWEKKT